jgi:hypothetical protein
MAIDPVTAFLIYKGVETGFNMYTTAQQNALQAQNYEQQAAEILRAGKENYQFSLEEAQLIRRVAAENARQVEFAGMTALAQEEIAGKARIGRIRARAGSSGASVNVGTPANVQISQEFQNQYNQRMINYNTRYEAARTRLQGQLQADMKVKQAAINWRQAQGQAGVLRGAAGATRGSRDQSLFGTLFQGVSSGISGFGALK